MKNAIFLYFFLFTIFLPVVLFRNPTQELFNEVNAAGPTPLAYDARLTMIARQQCEDIADRPAGTVNHIGDDGATLTWRALRVGYFYSKIGVLQTQTRHTR